MSDGLHGPIIDGRRAVPFALLDDHSRYVVGHRWGHGEDTLGMQAALHDAVKTHGCPQSASSASVVSARSLSAKRTNRTRHHASTAQNTCSPPSTPQSMTRCSPGDHTAGRRPR